MKMAQFSIIKTAGSPDRYKVEIYLRDRPLLEIKNLLSRRDARTVVASHFRKWLEEEEHLKEPGGT